MNAEASALWTGQGAEAGLPKILLKDHMQGIQFQAQTGRNACEGLSRVKPTISAGLRAAFHYKTEYTDRTGCLDSSDEERLYSRKETNW